MELRSQVIDGTRTLCNCLVVLVHAYPFLYFEHKGFDWYLMRFITCYLAHLLLPTLFLISGWLLFRDFTIGKYGQKLLSRMKRLLIPFVCWNLLYVFLFALMAFLNSRAAGKLEAVNTVNGFAMSVLPLPWGAPLDTPMWFARDLFYLALISPIFYWCYRKIPLAAHVCVAIMPIVWAFIFNCGMAWFKPYEISTFYVGGLLAVRKRDLAESCLKNGRWLVPVAVAAIGGAFALDFYGIPTSLGAYGVRDLAFVLGAPLFICLAGTFPALYDNRVGEALRLAGFFIYAGHIYVVSLVMHGLKGRLGGCTLTSFAIALVSMVVMSVIYKLWRRMNARSLRFFDGTL